jgi:hypothetical protein
MRSIFNTFKVTALAATALGTSLTTHAATLLEWDFNELDNSTTSSVLATGSGSGLSGTITRGPGLTPGADKADAFGALGFDSINATNAFANGEYFVFTITADPGVTFSLDMLSFALNRSNTSGQVAGYWQYSLDGSSFTNWKSMSAIGAGTATAGKSLTSMSTLGSDLTQVTLRLSLYGNNNTTLPADATFYLVNGNAGANPLTLTGSAVPEPTTAGLLGAGVVILTAMSRKRKTNQA